MQALRRPVDSIKKIYNKYQRYLPLTFFLSGVVFDIFTLGRIDNLFNIIQQFIYIFLLGYLLFLEVLYLIDQGLVPKIARKYWQYKNLLIAFLFGSLLSAYTIFYFKSASSLNLLAFFLPLCTVLVINEFERFHRLGISVRFAIFSLCVNSYLAYTVPIFYGSVGFIPFFISCSTSAIIFLFFFRLLQFKTNNWQRFTKRIFVPAFGIQSVFLLLYILKAIPPVPLAVTKLGIYHQVEKQVDRYELTSLSRFHLPLMKSRFIFRENDKVYGYFRIFSPTDFNDEVLIHWRHKNARGQWYTTDKKPVKIVGGRKQGYRGYIYKNHYAPGDWRLQVETLDGREIGRKNFLITKDKDETARSWHVEYD